MNIRLNLGFTTVLFLIFLTLRLTDQVDWSWFWVASPIIFGWGITVLVLAAAAVLVAWL